MNNIRCSYTTYKDIMLAFFLFFTSTGHCESIKFKQAYFNLASKEIEKDVKKNLKDLISQHKVSYFDKNIPKSLALCLKKPFNDYDIDAHAFGISYEYESIEITRKRAMDTCKKYEKSYECKCSIVYENNKFLLDIPKDEKMQLSLRYLAGKPESNSRAIAGTRAPNKFNVPSYKRDIYNKIKDDNKIKINNNANSTLFSIPNGSKLSFIDCESDFFCICPDLYRYDVEPITKNKYLEYSQNLNKYRKNGLYGCYKQDLQSGTSQFDKPTQYSKLEDRCRYVGKLSRKEKEGIIPNGLVIPLEFWEKISYQTIDQVWFEGAIRVDKKGLPLVRPNNRVRPVIIASKNKYYKVYELFPGDKGWRCQISHVLSKPIFTMKNCKSKKQCKEKALDEYLTSLISELQKPPINAKLKQDITIPPGEVWLERINQSSTLLGKPYFERSSYIIQWWNPGPFSASYGFYASKGGFHSGGANLLVAIKKSVSISVGVNGTYEEADDNKSSRFDRAIKKSEKNALKMSCSKVGGKIKHGTCLL